MDNYYVHLSKAREQGVRSLFRRYFHPAAWYGLPLLSIRHDEIEPWFHAIKRKYPQEANLCLALFRACWKQGQIARLIPESAPAPGALLQKTPPNRRERFVTPQEMPRLLAKLAQAPVLLRAFITILLETACRSGEALSMQWEEVDLERGVWHQPGKKTKNGKPHTVALTKRAIAVLRELDPNSLQPFPYSKGYFEGQWLAFRTTCGLHDVTFHDLRRTRLTWLAADGMPLKDLQRVANHRSIVSTEPYLQQFGNLAPIRAAMEQTSQAMHRPAV